MPFYCFLFPRDKRMINQSGDFICVGLFSCLIVFVFQAYKRLCELGGRFVTPLLPSSLTLSASFLNNQIMSSPTAFPFSFKEDSCAQDVVEAMEQVGGLFSSCLKWAYEIFLGD